MRVCKRCNVEIVNNVKNCPLCNRLTQETSPEYETDFPQNISKKKYKNLIKIIIFVAISIISVSLVVDAFVPSHKMLSLFVMVSTLYVTFVSLIGINSHKNIGFMILANILGLSLFITFIDYYSGFLMWSINYVVPGLIILGSALITIIIFVKPMLLRDYVIYQFIIELLGICALLLVIFDISTVRWPSITSCIYCSLLCVGMFLFKDKGTKHELKKRFHF